MGGQLHRDLYRAHELISRVAIAVMLTERHFNFLSYPFDAHECE